MFISASEALNSDSTEANLSIENLTETMPALIKSNTDFLMNSKQRGIVGGRQVNPSSMSLGAGPLWWS